MTQSHLPEEYRFSHNFCFFLHDQLLETLKSGEEANIFSHRWELEEGESSPPNGITGDELISWLEANDHKDVVFILYFKQICAALLSDMLHFVYEALHCSEKCKLTVSYALLRKPFKENLFYLEWLLADPVDMLTKFDGDDLRMRSINRAFDEEKKRELIGKAMEKTHYGQWIDPGFIYDLRYNKNFSAGFERLFQQANHLVTTFRFMETDRSNFNFVFSDEQSWRSQWDGLYSFLPLLLFHTVEIVEALIANFAKRREGLDLTNIRTAIGMVFWLEKEPHSIASEEIKDDVRTLLEGAKLRCPNCASYITFADNQLLALYWEYTMNCNRCDWNIDLAKLSNDL